MRVSTRISVEHVIVATERSYEEVKASLESQLAVPEKPVEPPDLVDSPFMRFREAMEQRSNPNGFVIFGKVEQRLLQCSRGGCLRATQYAIGNQFLADQMIDQVPEIALYTPLRLAVFEEQGRTFVTYDRFTSLVGPCRRAEVVFVARVVEQRFEELVAAATANRREERRLRAMGAEAGRRLQ